MRNSGTGKVFGCSSLHTWLAVLITILLLPAFALGQTFVQQTFSPGGGSSSVTFTAVEGAGDLNVVIVAWNGTASINPGGVTDTEGNNYVLAATSAGQNVVQAIYYAVNIKGDPPATPNTVTVSFTVATTADMRVLEYNGFGASITVDNWAGASGAATTANSGSVTTTTTDLVVGAGAAPTFGTPGTNGSGLPGDMTSRTIDNNGNIAMDTNAEVAAGPYSATAGVSGGWVMQVVGFSVSGIPTSAPTVTGVTPFDGSTAGGLAVTISGTNFANGANALFGTAPSGLSLQNCTVNNSTTMTCTTPPDNSGPKDLTVVNVDGKTGSLPGLPSPPGFSYTTNPPTVTGISPATSTTNGGAQITVTGTNFDPDATVNVGGLLPRNGFGIFGDNIVVNSSTSITFTTPAMTTGLQPDGTTPASPADVTVVNPSGADQGSAKLSGALTYTLGNGPINFIQRGDAALSNGTTGSVPIPMPNPQGKNNLNVVIVSWNDALAQVSQVVDSEGNTYVPAFLTPVTDGVALSQIIYYAKNIKGDTGATNNQINITFSRNANTPDVRVLEYSGLDPNSPLDQALSNAGTTTTADTGPCTTTAAVELIVAAATVDAQVSGAGPGFVTSDFTFNGNNAEQKITSTIGSCEAQTELSGPGWVTQVVSFKTPSGAQTPDFSMTAVPPTSATVNAGSSASYGVTMTALNGFNGSVDLACSGLPAGAGCLFSPASPVTPTSSGLAETVTISTQSATPSGMSSITIKGTSGNLNHSATVTLTVNGSTSPGFVLSASALSPGSVSAGGSATSTITVTPTNGFTGTVNLTCNVTGGGSPEPTCALSSSSVNGSGTSTLTASTTGNTAKKMHSTGIFYAMLLPIGGMTLLGAGFTSRRRKLLGILLICLVISGLVFMVACGGGSSGGGGGGGGGTPAGTYTITVQGASGSINQSTTLTLTVQ